MLETSLFPWLVALGLGVGAVLSLEVGYRIGVRTQRGESPDTSHLGAVVGAMLGLLGLLLGFSYAGASGRYLERQQLVVHEANAIGTAYLRADLLEDAHRAQLKQALREYTDSRLALYESKTPASILEASDRSAAMHGKLWEAAASGVRVMPQFAMAVLPPVNEVIDLHTTHLASIKRHLPLLALGVLVVSAMVSLGMMGYSAGLSKKRNHGVTLALAFLVAVTLWITIDLDYPRRGLITIDDAPMVELKKSFTP